MDVYISFSQLEQQQDKHEKTEASIATHVIFLKLVIQPCNPSV